MKNKVSFSILIFIAISLLYADMSFAQKRRNKRKKDKEKISIYDVDTLINPIPIQTSMWHGKIDKQQRGVDVSDGKVDGVVHYGEDEMMTDLLTETMLDEIDQLQITIENLPYPPPTMESNPGLQTKIRYLDALENLLRQYNKDSKPNPIFYKKAVQNFRDLMIARHENRLMDFVKKHADIYTLTNNDLLEGFNEERDYLFTEMGRKEPLLMIKRLPEFAKYPYADETVKNAAKIAPNEVYNYASSSNYTLSNAIRRNKDPLVQTIVQIAQESRSPIRAMPFLSDVYNKKLTVAEVDKITADQDLFY